MTHSANSFEGPTFRQRLLGYASAARTIMAITDHTNFIGRVVSVDCDNFEMVLTRASGSLPAGTIVNVSFRELNAISVFDC